MMSDDDEFKECIDLNAEAIARMKEGKSEQSCYLLTIALLKLESCFYGTITTTDDFVCFKEQAESTAMGGECTEATSTVAASSCQHHRSSKRIKARDRKKQPRPSYMSISIENGGIDFDAILSGDNIFSLYPRMFYINYKDARALGILKVFFILLFNQAICQHVHALLYVNQRKTNPTRELVKVLWLYERVVEEIRAALLGRDLQEMLCILTAACNNSGHICSQLLLFRETRQCIARVTQLLRWSVGPTTLQQEDKKIFFYSMCTFLEGTTNLRNAPAA